MTDPCVAVAEPAKIGENRAGSPCPSHVVYRTFVTETVALNIETGQYHGLNATAGRMLEVLERGGRCRFRGAARGRVRPAGGRGSAPTCWPLRRPARTAGCSRSVGRSRLTAIGPERGRRTAVHVGRSTPVRSDRRSSMRRTPATTVGRAPSSSTGPTRRHSGDHAGAPGGLRRGAAAQLLVAQRRSSRRSWTSAAATPMTACYLPFARFVARDGGEWRSSTR